MLLQQEMGTVVCALGTLPGTMILDSYSAAKGLSFPMCKTEITLLPSKSDCPKSQRVVHIKCSAQRLAHGILSIATTTVLI